MPDPFEQLPFPPLKPPVSRPRRPSKAARLRAIIAQFREAHGNRPFTINELANWAIAKGLYPLSDDEPPATDH